ncbi:MAG: hypothetical protein HQK65_15455 [Desulfamplus sp.]|nr:hypothetical protein [Desulfamplus sp.]
MNNQNILSIKVKCYAGYRGEETPRSIFFESKEIRVEKMLDMWLAPDHRYFKCLGADKGVYITTATLRLFA